MACYIVSYDVSGGDDRDYDVLISAIEACGTAAPIAQSTWAVVTDADAETIGNHLCKFLPDGSRLFVVKSSGEAAWRNVICTSQWLRKFL